jgi:hypothetical protein
MKADTITFQEGLLDAALLEEEGDNARATFSVSQVWVKQTPASKRPRRMSVMHQRERKDYEGQRCALLTMKSRNTCTRATDFSSSG